MGLIILISEEYDFRYWLWNFPGTKNELIKDWEEGKAPANALSCDLATGFKGTIEKFNDQKLTGLKELGLSMEPEGKGRETKIDGFAHVFFEDTYLTLKEGQKIQGHDQNTFAKASSAM